MYFRWIVFVAFLATLVLSPSAQALNSAQQTFRVQVPTSMEISAPPNTVLVHTNNVLIFPAQRWTVKGNVAGGILVSFATNQPFTYTNNFGGQKTSVMIQRDASLKLGLASAQGPANWTITQPTATTNYLNGAGVATVQARSNGVGRAAFNLVVTFVNDTSGAFAPGEYETVVTGTVTAN